MVTTKKFVRVPVYVDAVQVTEERMQELAEWSKGTIRQTDIRNRGLEKCIHINVHTPMNERQKMAFPGDWILSNEKGFKVFTDEAFNRMFEPFQDLDRVTLMADNRKPQAPSPEDFDHNAMALEEKAAGKKVRDLGVKQMVENMTIKKAES